MPAVNNFHANQIGIIGPLSRGEDVTPSDSAELTEVCRAITVTTAGNVSITTMEDTNHTFYASAGGIYPMRAKIIRSTGTTASGIVAWS